MSSNINTILDNAKELIKDEMSELSYKTWILPLEISSIDDNNIVLVSKDQFKKEAVETRFKDLLLNSFNIILQKNCNLEIILDTDLDKKENNFKTQNTNLRKS